MSHMQKFSHFDGLNRLPISLVLIPSIQQRPSRFIRLRDLSARCRRRLLLHSSGYGGDRGRYQFPSDFDTRRCNHRVLVHEKSVTSGRRLVDAVVVDGGRLARIDELSPQVVNQLVNEQVVPAVRNVLENEVAVHAHVVFEELAEFHGR